MNVRKIGRFHHKEGRVTFVYMTGFKRGMFFRGSFQWSRMSQTVCVKDVVVERQRKGQGNILTIC